MRIGHSATADNDHHKPDTELSWCCKLLLIGKLEIAENMNLY